MSRQARVIQIGVGSVGSAVVRLLMQQRARWRDLYGVDVQVSALLDTRGSIVNPRGLEDSELLSALESKGAGRSLAEIAGGGLADAGDVLTALTGREARTVLVDCAAGEGTYGIHLRALQAGCNTVFSNKAPLAVDQVRYDSLYAVGPGRIWNEATVGARLPVISTLCSLLDTGDEVEEITGCLSGTLGYITSELMCGRRYSEAVRTARDLNYTEPDPRDDLCGLDVARKALILARTFGRKLDLEDVRVEPLMPVLDPGLSVDEFMEALHVADEEFEERVERASASGNSLRYVANVPAEGEVTVGLQEVAANSQTGSLAGPDNSVTFRTREGGEHPLTVIGPGAGPVNTAMGVLADVLMAARS